MGHTMRVWGDSERPTSGLLDCVENIQEKLSAKYKGRFRIKMSDMTADLGPWPKLTYWIVEGWIPFTKSVVAVFRYYGTYVYYSCDKEIKNLVREETEKFSIKYGIEIELKSL